MTSVVESPPELTGPRGGSKRSGARSGLLLGLASVVATAANYLFLVLAGRVLGSDDYGALAALLGALTVVLLPTGAIQLAVSREVSRRLASDQRAEADAFSWSVFRLALVATVPAVAIAAALVLPVDALLNIGSPTAVAIAATGIAAAFLLPVALGVLQGHQRFGAVGVMYVLPFALRLALFIGLAAIGFRLGGAVYAAVFAGIVATVVAVTLIEQPLRSGLRQARPVLRPFFAYLGPVVLGLIGIAILTNVDLLVAKARLPGDDAGEYAAASAFARVAFFLPATLLAVLFPRTAARQARGEETEDILGRSLLAVAAFCGALTLAYGLTGRGLIHTSFGGEFAEGGELLVPFALAMTCYALANVLVGFHLSRGETRYAWILALAVPIQLLVLALVPNGATGLVWANVCVAVALLLAHEVLVGSSVPALVAGARRFARSVPLSWASAREGLLVAAGAAALACAVTWPLARDLGSAFIGSIGADASAAIWWLWHLQQEGGYHLFGTTHHTLGGAPFGYAESNALNLQWLLPYYPAYLATAVVGEVVAYNLVVLSGLALSGIAMYALARYLRCSRAVAAWAGGVYMIFPAHLARIEHASLLHFEVLALTVLAALAAAARPSAWRLGLLALATLAAWLTSGYFGVMASLAALTVVLAAAASRREGGRIRLLAGAGAAVLAAAFVVGTLSTLAGADTSEIRERNTFDLTVYGLRPAELVVPPSGNVVLDDRLDGYHATRSHGANPSETSNYLGLLTIALALLGLAAAWRGRRRLDPRVGLAVVALPAVGVVALAFSTPSPVGFFGTTLDWTPSRVLWELLSPVRVPSRWTAVVMTALVPVAALGLEVVRRWIERRGGGVPRARLAATGAVAAAMVVSTLELLVPIGYKVTPTEPRPELYEAVAQAPDGAVAEYPLKRGDIYSFWQRLHRRDLVNGAPSRTFANEVGRSLVDPDAAGTAEALALAGATSIVTRPDAMDVYSNEPPDVPRRDWGPGYAILGSYADGSSVWRVTARPAPALVSLPTDSFVDGIVREDGSIGFPLTGQTGNLEVWAPAAGVVRLAFDVVPVGATNSLTVSGAEGSVTFDVTGPRRVDAVVRVPRGRSQLDLRIEPPQQAGEFPLEVSALRAERTSEAPAVVARPLAAGTAS